MANLKRRRRLARWRASAEELGVVAGAATRERSRAAEGELEGSVTSVGRRRRRGWLTGLGETVGCCRAREEAYGEREVCQA